MGGLSNLDVKDEPPYDYQAETQLPYNVNGLDTEGLVRLKNGDFWVAEEYSPSILKVDPSGKVVKRFVPQGLELPGADYPIVEALPAVYGKRKINRGFEGLALSPDEKTLFLVLQSPLLNPDAAHRQPVADDPRPRLRHRHREGRPPSTSTASTRSATST